MRRTLGFIIAALASHILVDVSSLGAVTLAASTEVTFAFPLGSMTKDASSGFCAHGTNQKGEPLWGAAQDYFGFTQIGSKPNKIAFTLNTANGHLDCPPGEFPGTRKLPAGLHRGLDLNGPTSNDPILLTYDGDVQIRLSSDCKTNYGIYALARHPTKNGMNNIWSLYGHLSRPNDEVLTSSDSGIFRGLGRRALIGFSGDTGKVFGEHLHFEIRYEDGNVNLHKLGRKATRPDVETYLNNCTETFTNNLGNEREKLISFLVNHAYLDEGDNRIFFAKHSVAVSASTDPNLTVPDWVVAMMVSGGVYAPPTLAGLNDGDEISPGDYELIIRHKEEILGCTVFVDDVRQYSIYSRDVRATDNGSECLINVGIGDLRRIVRISAHADLRLGKAPLTPEISVTLVTQPLGAPVIQGGQSFAVTSDDELLLQWSEISGAEKYTIDIVRSETEQHHVSLNSNATAVRLPKLPTGSYTGRIWASGSGIVGESAGFSVAVGSVTELPTESVDKPEITSVLPITLTASDNLQMLEVRGQHIQRDSKLVFETPAGSTFDSASHDQTWISPAVIGHRTLFSQPGPWAVSVVNPDGRHSNRFSFTVEPAPIDAPQISTITPQVATYSTSRQAVRIDGSSFNQGAYLVFKAPTGPELFSDATYLTRPDSTRIDYQIALSEAGQWTVRVVNPGPVTSDAKAFTVQSTGGPAPPSITTISPSTFPSSPTPQTIMVDGSHFSSESQLVFRPPTGGDIHSTPSRITSRSPTRIVYEAVFITSGSWLVQTLNPDGVRSKHHPFTVTPPVSSAPTVHSISPASPPYSTSLKSFSVFGDGFVDGATLKFSAPTGPELNSINSRLSFVDSRRIDYMAVFSETGTWTVRVINPSGIQSNPYSFQVAGAESDVPKVTSTIPGSPLYSTGLQSLVVNGAHFQPGARLVFRLPSGLVLSSSSDRLKFINSTQITYLAYLSEIGVWSVRVVNPNGLLSNWWYFQVTQ